MKQIQQYISNKTKASSLIEVIVAAVIIVIIFSISSLIVNNSIKSFYKNDKQAVHTALHKTMYFYQHKQLAIPYETAFKNWQIKVETIDEATQQYIRFTAVDTKTKKEITKYLFNEQE